MMRGAERIADTSVGNPEVLDSVPELAARALLRPSAPDGSLSDLSSGLTPLFKLLAEKLFMPIL